MTDRRTTQLAVDDRNSMTTTNPDSMATSTIVGDGAVTPLVLSTGTRGTRVAGVITIVSMIWLVLFGLGFSPADRDQDEAVRLLYVHVPTIWVAYLAFIVTAAASAMVLFRRRSNPLGWDRVAGASAELGTAFVAVTLVIGSLWGRLTWGVFWQWDARLTTTALLFVTYIGYLAVRRLDGTHQQRAKRSAVIGLIAVVEIPLVHWSVRLWRSLHQEATVLNTSGDIDMDGLMLFSLFVGVVAFTSLYVWLMMHRTRVMAMEDLIDDRGLDEALLARRQEGAAVTQERSADPRNGAS
jgi:heme exporter protein C